MIRPWVCLALLSCASVAALSGCGGSHAGRAGAGHGRPRTGETLIQGTVVALPFVGTLGWRCSPFGASSRFTTGLVLPRPGATVYADLWADGRRVWRHRQIDPLPDPSLTLITNTPPALHRQTWRLRYHHATATMTALVRMRFHVNEDEARCFVSPVDVTTRRR